MVQQVIEEQVQNIVFLTRKIRGIRGVRQTKRIMMMNLSVITYATDSIFHKIFSVNSG